MTLTASPIPATGPATPRPGHASRAARLAMPRSVDVVKDLAAEYGVCARPVVLRRTDLDSGRTVIVDLPCGATLDAKCPACAARARRLRGQQIREGWHRHAEPLPEPDPPTDDQVGLLVVRAHLEFDRAQSAATADWDGVAACDEAIRECEEDISATGLRGAPAPPHATDNPDDLGRRRVRSTRRRQDAPDLPRKPVQPHTVGRTYTAPDGRSYRPSLFLTLTLPSYGRVHPDGTPMHPDRYDYRQAAWDAVHFPRLLDRFWQNLRRAAGWNIQYAGAVEPQRRLAPHAHFAIRGTISRELIRQVAAATYHQVWWPLVDRQARLDTPPTFDDQANTWVHPHTGAPLPTWQAALDALDEDPDAAPAHVVRFGAQVHAQGVLAGTPDADRCVRYITKYLTKHAADCHDTTGTRQQQHLDRLWHELRHTPCSERCANWLLYGVQPRNAHGKLQPGRCKARVHHRATLGLGGRRVLISRQWSGKTLADHRADNHAWVRQLLGLTVDLDHAGPPGQISLPGGEAQHPNPSRYAWEIANPRDPDIPPLAQRLLRHVSERIQQRTQLDAARRASPPTAEALR